MRHTQVVPLLFSLFLADAPGGAQPPGGMRAGVYSEGTKIEHVWIDDSKGLEVRASGEIDLREGIPDVAGLSPGAYLVVQQRVGSSAHRAEWRAAIGGGLARSYTVDGRARDFADARQWLDRFFPEAIARTGVEVRARYRQILTQRGVSAVLEEAAAARVGPTRETFLEALAERDLTDSETQRFLQVVRGISRDGTRRAILLKLAGRPLTPAQWSGWLAAASTVTSAPERRELLSRAAAGYPRGRALPDDFFNALDGISSTPERREVLIAVLAARGSDPGTLALVLASAAKLSSSSERRVVLERAAHFPIPAGILPQYLRVAAELSSSGDRREALSALLGSHSTLQSSAAAVAWVRAVKQVPAESDRATLLMSSIGQLPHDRPTHTAFTEALGTLYSDTNYNRVATAYLRSRAARR